MKREFSFFLQADRLMRLLQSAEFNLCIETIGNGGIRDYFSVTQNDVALGITRNVQLVRDHDDGDALVVQLDRKSVV